MGKVQARLARWGALALAMGGALPAAAEVTRFEILAREAPALGGREFGARGTAEKITARATLALDPANPRNAVIVDLDRAPRNAQGRVEATTDVVILRPARPNGTLLFEVLNRGRKLLPGWVQDTEGTAGLRLAQPGDAGNGFLLDQGFTLVWAGWQHDSPQGADLLRIALPTVPGVSGPSREEWTFSNATSPQRVTLSYPVADRASARLTVRARTDMERQTPAGLGFSFIDDSTLEITRPEGMAAGALYELTYTARDPQVTGIGLAAIRDVTAFLRRATGPENPLAVQGRPAVDRAIGLGISQSGRVLRDLLYFGMNEDEAGRLVFEGMMPVIPGARRSFTNARFGQPGRNPGPQYDRLFPVLGFPFTYAVMEDAVSGKRDGILLRCSLTNSCPVIMQMDSEFEFWGSQASLLVTDTAGNHHDLPSNVRAYMVAGAPHGNPWNAVARRSEACGMALNPLSQGAALRALIVAMEAWVREGVEPPASRFPTLAAGTLTRPEMVYPAIPGLPYRGQYVRAEFIEQTAPLPTAGGSYPIFLPRAGLDGNAVGGIRLPIIEAPRASYVGWNAQTGAEGPQEICTQVGGVVPFAETRAARQAAGDPRPSIEELYPTPESYVAAVRQASARLVAARLLLPADAEAAVAAAQAGQLARLAP
ncbi:alpha/beta hydrolase domain-containing protein [Falsiroseomonas sp.]|uniref:alpha/beta hydrolase domain-containing protein n=1 Tax=Falsiroseomonas sp. TaxID=2870721 RepID=UPI003F6F4235